MTMIKKFALSAGAAAAAMAMSLSAYGATLSYPSGSLTTFDGFDWTSFGTAFTSGFTPTDGQAFQLTYFASAVALQSPNTVPAGMDINADGNPTGFGYTIVAKLNEQVTQCFNSGQQCTFQVLAGSTFDIYYNSALTANALAGSKGTGFMDGIKIISGTVDVTSAGGGGFFGLVTTPLGLGGTGSASLFGKVTYTDSTYIAPDLVGTIFGTQLNFGTLASKWTNPNGFAGTAFNDGNIVFQADGNQTFTQAVPEPGSLALVSLALLGAGAVARRRKS